MDRDPKDEETGDVTLAEPVRETRIEELGLGDEGRYTQRALLGKGGMGDIWEWRDERISRLVACKVLRREHGVDGRMQLRFLRDARIQGQLEHPAVVPVYDLALTPSGDLYVTRKRVRGKTLG